jgi:hypothetical protein
MGNWPNGGLLSAGLGTVPLPEGIGGIGLATELAGVMVAGLRGVEPDIVGPNAARFAKLNAIWFYVLLL